MTSAKFSDVDKKVFPADECYIIKIKSPDRVWLEGDIHKTQKGETIENLIKLFLQNGRKWYKNVSTDDGGWKKVYEDE